MVISSFLYSAAKDAVVEALTSELAEGETLDKQEVGKVFGSLEKKIVRGRPLGLQAAAETGKSIFFMVASNPGPGLGMLLAYAKFGQGLSKRSAPSAIIIHFFGGIHELYFPYVLMKPIMIVAMIAGAATGIATFNLFDAGLVAGPSPGSKVSVNANSCDLGTI